MGTMTTPMSPHRWNQRVATSHIMPYILTRLIKIKNQRILKNYSIFTNTSRRVKRYTKKIDSDVLTAQEDSLYPYVNNDIEYGLFEDIV